MAKGKKLNPNDPCPCGSGKKYKDCCKHKADLDLYPLLRQWGWVN